MLIVFAAILVAATFVFLVRRLWLNAGPDKTGVVATLAIAGLIIGLAVLAATGRLHWIAALGAAILPFLRRAVGMIRYLPWIRQLFQQRRADGQSSSNNTGTATDSMTADRARAILGLGPQPNRDDIIAAHRRLMQKLHPDRGGSTYLAAQLNEARRVLLGEL